ncbi:hypothetical protein V8B97DRAFT_1932479 [Scleroderma yunnanense]
MLDQQILAALEIFALTNENPVLSVRDIQHLCELRYPRLRATVDDVLITSELPRLSPAPFTRPRMSFSQPH